MVARQETEHNIGGAPTRALSPRRCQAGRSMIEMLAVLAIIGILSVAALAGLMWAMAKYRANDTIHDVHIWQLAALDSQQLYSMTSGQLVLNELGEVSTHGYPMAIMVQDENVFYISVDDVPKRVCSLTLDMLDETHFVTVNNVRYEGTDICNMETDSLNFYFNKYMGEVGSICIPSCTGDERCCNNTCKQIETPCGEDGCLDCGSDYCTTTNTCCPTPDATKCGDNDCCETKCCNGVCCPESYMTCDATTTCGCPNNMVPDADTGACKCPDDAPYYFENEGICCQSGYTPIEGVCQKVDCRGGPTSYNCYINDKPCGANCNSLGRDCSTGICHADDCNASNGETFGIGLLSSRYYGCFKTRPDGIECQTFYSTRSFWNCFTPEKDAICCTADSNLECLLGTCDENICPEGFETGTFYNKSSACINKDELTICIPYDGMWRCYKNHLHCKDYCQDPQTCCDTQEPCIDGYTFNPSNKRCENTNGYCLSNMTAGKNVASDGYQACYTKDDKRCGVIEGRRKEFLYGSCTDPGCPEGMIYGYVSSADGFYGCIDEKLGNKGLACYAEPDYSPTVCYYNEVLCGRRCNYDGTNCGQVYLPQCALAGHCPQTGYDMSDGCTCDGDVTTVEGTDYCCPTGHTYINGACAMT